MTAVAPERSLVDLIVRPGMDVVMFGTVDLFTAPDEITVWALNPWVPTRPRRDVGGNVTVVAAALPRGVKDGAVVRVRGTWAGSRIDAAIVETTAKPVVAQVVGPPNRVSLRDAGLERFLELTSAVHATRASAIGSGGGSPDDTAWFHVLYVTPELVELIEQTTLRAAFQVVITPSD